MAIKKLQNNFTTLEQSKRLLELGVPEDSADCYLLRTHTKGDTFVVEVLHDELYSKKDKFTNMLEYLPCWSAGRLMEIYDTCFIYPKSRSSWCAHTRVIGVLFVNYILDCYKNAIADKLLDFSKLEE